MSVLLFLNELPCSIAQPKAKADEAMERFVRLLMRVTRWRGDTALISLASLADLELVPGYFVAEWARQPRHIDLWRAIRRLQNRAPFSAVLPAGAGDGVDYFWEGSPVQALGAAHLLDGLLVSLQLDEAWDSPWIRANRQQLVETISGEADIVTDTVEVRHAATLPHADVHEDWIKRVGLPELRHGGEVWESRADLFPNLQFLPHVRDHLYGIRVDWVTPAAYELRRIEDAIANWDPRLRRLPVWRSKVTPESETRRQLCRFVDLDGAERVFDLHGRFTPGHGRIYFRLAPEKRTAIVAHIGLKLGI